MTLLGGLGTVWGPVVGAFILVPVQSYFAEAGEWVTIINGSVLIAVILLMRHGVVGEFPDLIRRVAAFANKRISKSLNEKRTAQPAWLKNNGP
jgi:hypothetical protein